MQRNALNDINRTAPRAKCSTQPRYTRAVATFVPAIPDEIWPEGATRPSNEPELAFRRMLEAALVERPWTVVQNLLVQDPDRVGTREIDFLVIDPTRGMLVIEVKGGDYRFDPTNGWHRRVGTQIRRDGRGAPKQAIAAMYALVNLLASQALHDKTHPPYLHGWLIATPDIEIRADSLPPDAQGHVLDSRVSNEPARLLANIEDLFNALAARYPEVTCGADSCVPELVARHILPETRTRLGVRDEIRQARAIETDILRPVRSIIDAAHAIDRLHVRGFPGTGKTYAALRRAANDHADGLRTLVLCYNIPLAASLTARLRAEPTRPETPLASIRTRSLVVARFHALAAAAAREATDITIPAEDAGQAHFDALVTALIEAARAGALGAFDSIVIDEGQDFTPHMLDAVEALAATTRRTRPRIAFFHDPNQCLYDGASDEEVEERFGQPLVLSENLRNSASITAFLRSLDPERLGALHAPPSMRSGQPVVVWSHPHGDGEAVRDAITRIVRHLVEAEDVRPDDIVLISPFRHERTSLASITEIAELPLLSLEQAARRTAEHGPCLRRETLHRFKGLEVPVVILHDVAGSGPNVEFEAILTACSRAQHALYIVRSDDYRGDTPLPIRGALPA